MAEALQRSSSSVADLATSSAVRGFYRWTEPDGGRPTSGRHLPEEEIRRRIKEIVDDVDAQAARRVVLNGNVPPGPEAIRKQDPHTIPEHTKKSPAPAVHAASKAIRKQMKEAYRIFVEAYREATASLRAGNLNAKFPPGCFPPPQPFIPADAGLPCSRAGPAHAPG